MGKESDLFVLFPAPQADLLLFLCILKNIHEKKTNAERSSDLGPVQVSSSRFNLGLEQANSFHMYSCAKKDTVTLGAAKVMGSSWSADQLKPA